MAILPSLLAKREHVTKRLGQRPSPGKNRRSSWIICNDLHEWFVDNDIDVYYDHYDNKITIVFASDADMALYLLRWTK